jgi:peptidoglycan/LPS O-acetylase OafA/YrhL
MPQLDALRALAVFGVWIAHWDVGKLSILRSIPFGELGVQLFFVLSGYLITRILLHARDTAHSRDAVWAAAKRFYVYRALRIFPIYYLTLFASCVVIQHMREGFGWHLTYTSNVFFTIRGHLDLAGAHFWTLSVEEQFYLLWPGLILTVPRRWLLWVIVASIASGVLWRASAVTVGYNGLGTILLPFGCSDQLGFGALLAYSCWAGDPNMRKSRILNVGFLLGILLMVVLTALRVIMPATVWIVVMPFATALGFAWLIGRAAQGFGGLGGVILNSAPLLYLGKISYGLYIYHAFVSWVILRGAAYMTVELPESEWIRFVIYAAVTIAVASLSWHVIESPIMNLRRRLFLNRKTSSEVSLPEPAGRETVGRRWKAGGE